MILNEEGMNLSALCPAGPWIRECLHTHVRVWSLIHKRLRTGTLCRLIRRLLPAVPAPARAPPLTTSMVQALAGCLTKCGYASTAVMVLVGHHCMLRTCELFELRTGDVAFTNRRALLVLRETKMGQRLGIHQETTVSDEWLVRCLQRAHAATRPGCCLVGVTPYRF